MTNFVGPVLRLSCVAALLASWSGCSSLPAYAAPQGAVVDPKTVDRSDVISYRTLTREDFRGTEPAGAQAHAAELGALTCTYIVSTPDTGYEVVKVEGGGSKPYAARLTSLGFVAEMDRNCSWWNENNTQQDIPYILQHEQIHFALAELEARRRNSDAPELVAELRIQASSPDDAGQQIQKILQDLVQDAMNDLLEVNEDFDEDTSAKHDPKTQQEWYDRVTHELKSGPSD